jgi:hypothetical protein
MRNGGAFPFRREKDVREMYLSGELSQLLASRNIEMAALSA